MHSSTIKIIHFTWRFVIRVSKPGHFKSCHPKRKHGLSDSRLTEWPGRTTPRKECWRPHSLSLLSGTVCSKSTCLLVSVLCSVFCFTSKPFLLLTVQNVINFYNPSFLQSVQNTISKLEEESSVALIHMVEAQGLEWWRGDHRYNSVIRVFLWIRI
jgi:hypothetical protein